MSLTRIALRVAAVEALRNRTRVGGNVLDSPNGAIDIQADGAVRIEGDQPFVSVFTDEGMAEDIVGRSLFQNGRCVLVIEAGISQAMTKKDRETGAQVIVGINVPASDRAFEFHLDIVQREICDALTDPNNEWADIYRSLHLRVVKIEVAGVRQSDDGQRLAGRQTRITVDLMDDPVPGVPLDPDAPLSRFLVALKASDQQGYAEMAGTIEDLLTGPEPDWQVQQRQIGATRDELLALGLGPIEPDVDRTTPVLEEVEGVPEAIQDPAP